MLNRTSQPNLRQEQSPNSFHEGLVSQGNVHAHESVPCLDIGSQDARNARAGLLSGMNFSGLAHVRARDACFCRVVERRAGRPRLPHMRHVTHYAPREIMVHGSAAAARAQVGI